MLTPWVGPCGAGDPGGEAGGARVARASRALADGRALSARTGGRTAPSAPPGPRGPKDPLGEGTRLDTTKATPNWIDIAEQNRYKLIQK